MRQMLFPVLTFEATIAVDRNFVAFVVFLTKFLLSLFDFHCRSSEVIVLVLRGRIGPVDSACAVPEGAHCVVYVEIRAPKGAVRSVHVEAVDFPP